MQKKSSPSSASDREAVLTRQLNAPQLFFRVAGFLRYLLKPFLTNQSIEACRRAMLERSAVTPDDPQLLVKATAGRLLRDIYPEAPHNQKMARWLEGKLAEMDPADPRWLEMWEHHQDSDYLTNMQRPGSENNFMIFLQLCQECEKNDKNADFLMERVGPGLVARAVQSPPLGSPTMEARQRHMRSMEEDPEYRELVETTLASVREFAASDPRIAKAMRDSLGMTRFLGYPGNSTLPDDFAVVHEEVDALLRAMESGEVTPVPPKDKLH
ncbi:MAG: hypothetical protein HQM03_11555 [Magnetococcales bacterium]|nr:hypothetical protein [Magnetococcales bacterium]